MGRGSRKRFGPTRNVDIILVAPDIAGTCSPAAAHVLLGVHPESGAWRLMAGADCKVEDEDFLSGREICLRLPRTRIEILGMQYSIRFEVNTPDKESEYLRQRNTMLLKEGYPLPHTSISGIPVSGDMIFESIAFRHGLGSGAFGSVYEGFDPSSGDLRVAKRIILKSAREVQQVELEIKALERFSGQIGIVELLEWRTSLNSKDLLVNHYPLDIYLVHNKGVAFNNFDWNTVSWDIKQSLCYQLLTGLTIIHTAGCMHRDITPMNILVFPHEEPPQAALCDFGKFCDTPTEVETRLAAWQFLPPELQDGKKNPYDQKLDIWMLGYALVYSWWPQAKSLHPRKVKDYEDMQSILIKDRTSNGLGVLIAAMMTADPRRRPSAVDALRDKTLRQCACGSAHDTTSNKTSKRPHSSTDR